MKPHRAPLLALGCTLVLACAPVDATTAAADTNAARDVDPGNQGLSTTAPSTTAAPASPEQAFARLESALVEGDVDLEFEIEATGAVSALVTGSLELGGDRIALHAGGSFAGQNIRVDAIGDGHTLVGGPSAGSQRFGIAQTPAVRDAFAIGLTRMGILHNVAMLMGGNPPDHATGGVRDWVRVRELEDGSASAAKAPSLPENARAYSFELVVDEVPSGHATLWVASDGRTLLERHQSVAFPEGDMHVVERYRMASPR